MSLGHRVGFVHSLKMNKKTSKHLTLNQGNLDVFIIGSSSRAGEQWESIGFANVFYIVFCFLCKTTVSM